MHTQLLVSEVLIVSYCAMIANIQKYLYTTLLYSKHRIQATLCLSERFITSHVVCMY
jgi:hypothetical protein